MSGVLVMQDFLRSEIVPSFIRSKVSKRFKALLALPMPMLQLDYDSPL